MLKGEGRGGLKGREGGASQTLRPRRRHEKLPLRTLPPSLSLRTSSSCEKGEPDLARCRFSRTLQIFTRGSPPHLRPSSPPSSHPNVVPLAVTWPQRSQGRWESRPSVNARHFFDTKRLATSEESRMLPRLVWIHHLDIRWHWAWVDGCLKCEKMCHFL